MLFQRVRRKEEKKEKPHETIIRGEKKTKKTQKHKNVPTDEPGCVCVCECSGQGGHAPAQVLSIHSVTSEREEGEKEGVGGRLASGLVI